MKHLTKDVVERVARDTIAKKIELKPDERLFIRTTGCATHEFPRGTVVWCPVDYEVRERPGSGDIAIVIFSPDQDWRLVFDKDSVLLAAFEFVDKHHAGSSLSGLIDRLGVDGFNSIAIDRRPRSEKRR